MQHMPQGDVPGSDSRSASQRRKVTNPSSGALVIRDEPATCCSFATRPGQPSGWWASFFIITEVRFSAHRGRHFRLIVDGISA